MICIGMAAALVGCAPKQEEPVEQPQPKEEFKYLVDEFADLRIMRYQIPDWDQLTLQQKSYIYYLGEAAKCGRDILADQNFKYNLVVRKTIEAVLNSYQGDRECEDFQNFVVYAKRVFFSNGIHHHYAEDKFFPEVSEAYFADLVKGCDASLLPLNEGESVDDFIAFLTPVVFDKELYKMRRSSEEDIIANSAVNFYEGGIKKGEVEAFYGKMRKPNDATPISYGLNSKLVKENGKIHEDVYKADGLYGEAIQAIIGWLQKANEVAENDIQRDYTQKLIDYYTTGDLKTWDEYNIAWVQDSVSHIDFVNGFIEDYNDPMGMKATWESIVDYKDLEATKRSNTIGENAQWFEDNSPVDPRFKKEECKGVSAKSIIVKCRLDPQGLWFQIGDYLQPDGGLRQGRRRVPEKCLGRIRLFARRSRPLQEIRSRCRCGTHQSARVLGSRFGQAAAWHPAWRLEGVQLDAGRGPRRPLRPVPDAEAYKAEYCSYIRNGMMSQLARVELGKDVTESHMQNRKLISEWCYEHGKDANVIEKKVENGKTYFVINDFEALRGLFGELLAEIQRIKSEGDYAAGKAIVEKYAVKVDQELHKEVKERYNALGLKPYGGFINPEIVPVTENGKVVDYKVEYPSDFVEQHLKYGKDYSFLKATH